MNPSRLRIIGGRWRGRRLHLPADTTVRPSPARLRETLFNWLSECLEARSCLDLFAGSGALGLEALSRGAASATFVDKDARLCARLKKLIGELGAGATAAIIQTSAARFLASSPAPPVAPAQADGAKAAFNLVFLDPPFGAGLLETTLSLLARRPHLLGDDALVYVEHPRHFTLSPPPGWSVRRQTRAASVACALLAVGRGAAVV